jgi:hypothetical protein
MLPLQLPPPALSHISTLGNYARRHPSAIGKRRDRKCSVGPVETLRDTERNGRVAHRNKGVRCDAGGRFGFGRELSGERSSGSSSTVGSLGGSADSMVSEGEIEEVEEVRKMVAGWKVGDDGC